MEIYKKYLWVITFYILKTLCFKNSVVSTTDFMRDLLSAEVIFTDTGRFI
ncbi:MAG: hypothetical protein ACI8Q1_003723 [Parvicella sp.]|jgi:hypothetical protein